MKRLRNDNKKLRLEQVTISELKLGDSEQADGGSGARDPGSLSIGTPISVPLPGGGFGEELNC
jgi:hypothetical protein